MASGKSSTVSNAYTIYRIVYTIRRIIYDSTYMLRDTTIGAYANAELSTACRQTRVSVYLLFPPRSIICCSSSFFRYSKPIDLPSRLGPGSQNPGWQDASWPRVLQVVLQLGIHRSENYRSLFQERRVDFFDLPCYRCFCGIFKCFRKQSASVSAPKRINIFLF